MVFELLGEAKLNGDSIWGARGDRRERLLVARLAGAKKEELRVEGEVSGVAEHEVEALLRDESRAHRDDRHLVGGPQPGLELKRFAALELASEIRRVVGRGDDRIARRIPHALVDAGGDADESI